MYSRFAKRIVIIVGGISIIETVERTDKTFAIGLQFHPEAAIVKHLNHSANADQFLGYDTALRFFQRLVQEADAYADQKSEPSQLTFFGWAKQQFSRLAAA